MISIECHYRDGIDILSFLWYNIRIGKVGEVMTIRELGELLDVDRIAFKKMRLDGKISFTDVEGARRFIDNEYTVPKNEMFEIFGLSKSMLSCGYGLDSITRHDGTWYSKTSVEQTKKVTDSFYIYKDLPDSVLSGDIITKLWKCYYGDVISLVESGLVSGTYENGSISNVRKREIESYFKRLSVITSDEYRREGFTLTFDDVMDVLRLNDKQVKYITNKGMLNYQFEGRQLRYNAREVLDLSKYCFSANEIAQALGVPEHTAGNHIWRGNLDYIRVGKEVRVNREYVDIKQKYNIERKAALALLGVSSKLLRTATKSGKLSSIAGIDGRVYYSDEIYKYATTEYNISAGNASRMVHKRYDKFISLVEAGKIKYKIDLSGKYKFRESDLKEYMYGGRA